MIDYVHCDAGCVHDGKPMRLPLDRNRLDFADRGHWDYITQHTAALIARAASWTVMHGEQRDYHFCPLHDGSIVAVVLRFAAGKVRGVARGIHAALHELGIGATTDLAQGVWAFYYRVNGPDSPGSHSDRLNEAARRAEARW